MVKVIYFTQDNCAACDVAKPSWKSFQSRNNGRADFIDLDVRKDDVSKYNIVATPSWIILNEDQEIYRTLGADFSGMQTALDSLSPTPTPESPQAKKSSAVFWGIVAIIFYFLTRSNEDE